MMADYGLKRNGSGYKDETAYKAFMGMAKSGEVWTANNGREQVLILKNQGTFCNCLTLTDKSNDNQCIEIIISGHPRLQEPVLATLDHCKQRSALVGEADLHAGTMYTNPGMVKYLFNSWLGTFVQKLPASEFEKVREAVEDALSIGRKAVDKDHRKECHDLLDKILDKVGVM